MSRGIVVHTPWGGDKKFDDADFYSVEDGFLDIGVNGIGVIASFPADSWQWVECLYREPTNEQPLHPRRERTSSEEAVVRPIRGA